MLGLSKFFIFILILALIIAWATGDWLIGLVFFGVYAIIKIGWNFLTK
jgi:hypothetical protein